MDDKKAQRLREQMAEGAFRIVVNSVQAGENVTVDATDPCNPVVSASGGGAPVVFSQTTVLVEDDLNDNTNPVVVVTGVAGKIIVPIKATAVFTYVDNTYGTNAGAQFDAVVGTVTVGQPFFYIQGFSDSATSQFQTQPLNDNVVDLTASMVGQDMTCAATGVVTENGPGSSTVTVTVWYGLIDAPPAV